MQSAVPPKINPKPTDGRFAATRHLLAESTILPGDCDFIRTNNLLY
jgi:hypothetical protein